MCLQGFILRLVRASRDRNGLGREPLGRYDRGGAISRSEKGVNVCSCLFPARPPAPDLSRLLLFPEGAQDGGYHSLRCIQKCLREYQNREYM